MVKYPQMKFAAFILFLFAFAFAGGGVVVSPMPETVRPFAEVETNVAFLSGVPSDNYL